MRIKTTPSAAGHGITDAEIRAVISFPALRLGLVARHPNALPVLFIGPAAENQPWMEVIADLADPDVAVAFHAMMLRTALVASLGIEELIAPEYAAQRQ